MKKKYLITSALPYINGVKHLGNLIGSMLPADVFAKFLRQKGHDVLFICGTDEHGTPAEIAAQEENLPIEQYCEQMYTLQKDIYEKFDLSFDHFGRSSSQSNHALTKDIFLKLKENGYIFEKEIKQYYSHADNRFLPDRYVEGACPHCGFEKARGDQCDGCGVLLDPEKLLNPYSSISGSKDIELQSTKHIFLDLTKAQGKVQSWVEEQPNWPDVVKGIAKKWLNEGLQPRCITRDLKWGIPVPLDGYDNKVFYVWFDAPNAYISITEDWAKLNNYGDEWKNWWSDSSKDVTYFQFMAKDNVPFHAIFWPSVLFAADMGFRQVDYIKGFHWLTYDKGKFSTSQKRGVFTDKALELFPADYWRYYLMANIPETADSDFSFVHFAAIVNKDLADILGNFSNRTLSLLQKYNASKVPFMLDEETLDKALLEKAKALVLEIEENFYALKFRNALQSLRALWVLGNEYITSKEPWSLMKTDEKAAKVCLVHCIHLLRLFAITSYPVIPTLAQKILDLLNDSQTNLSKSCFEDGSNFSFYAKDHQLSAPERLVEKIEETKVVELAEIFSGK